MERCSLIYVEQDRLSNCPVMTFFNSGWLVVLVLTLGPSSWPFGVYYFVPGGGTWYRCRFLGILGLSLIG